MSCQRRVKNERRNLSLERRCGQRTNESTSANGLGLGWGTITIELGRRRCSAVQCGHMGYSNNHLARADRNRRERGREGERDWGRGSEGETERRRSVQKRRLPQTAAATAPPIRLPAMPGASSFFCSASCCGAAAEAAAAAIFLISRSRSRRRVRVRARAWVRATHTYAAISPLSVCRAGGRVRAPVEMLWPPARPPTSAQRLAAAAGQHARRHKTFLASVLLPASAASAPSLPPI